MDRRNFLKSTCKACLLSAAAFSMADLLDACGTTMKGFKTMVNNNQVAVPLTLFATSDLQIISPRNYDYEIAVRKNADSTYTALLMRCTHQANQLIPTGNGFVCSLHGSQFDKNGEVKKGPAEKHLQHLATTINDTNLIIHI